MRWERRQGTGWAQEPLNQVRCRHHAYVRDGLGFGQRSWFWCLLCGATSTAPLPLAAQGEGYA